MLSQYSDPFKLVANNVADEEQVDIVADLEKELRSEKKQDVLNSNSQIQGSSGKELVDNNGNNRYLENKVRKFAKQDNIQHTSTQSVLGDFSALLDGMSESQNNNNGFARNQLMAMGYSTIKNTQSQAALIAESSLTYQLAHSQFGLEDRNKKTVKHAKKFPKLANNSVY